MGDVGDYWREEREWKRDLRANWHECPECEIAFGTGKKIPPGGSCPHHGWKAPGKPGEDVEKAEKIQAERAVLAEREAAEKAKRKARRTCPHCGRLFGSPQAAAMHARDKHKNPTKETAP